MIVAESHSHQPLNLNLQLALILKTSRMQFPLTVEYDAQAYNKVYKKKLLSFFSCFRHFVLS